MNIEEMSIDEILYEYRYGDYWKSTSINRNIAISSTIDILKNNGLDRKLSHDIGMKIENIWIDLMKKEEDPEDRKILEIIKEIWIEDTPFHVNNNVGHVLHLSVDQFKIIDKIIRGDDP